MCKRHLCAAVLMQASFSVWAASADADSYPNRPIRVIDGYAAGGNTDYVARVLGAKLTERFGQPVIVDNRPGAAATVATEITARSNPDGYTLFIALGSGLTSSPSLYSKLGYDLMKDFAYITVVANATYVLLVNPAVPVKSVSEFVALARSKPKAMRYGSAGVGSPIHLAMELLKSRTAMDLQHVPYKGGAPAAIAAAGGEVDIMFTGPTAAVPLIQAKRLNALAVSGVKRIGVLPEVPTVAESGVPGYDVTDPMGILAPAATPGTVVKLLNAELRNILQKDDVRAKLTEQGLEVASSTPEGFRAMTEAQIARWARVIKDAKIPAN